MKIIIKNPRNNYKLKNCLLGTIELRNKKHNQKQICLQ